MKNNVHLLLIVVMSDSSVYTDSSQVVNAVTPESDSVSLLFYMVKSMWTHMNITPIHNC